VILRLAVGLLGRGLLIAILALLLWGRLLVSIASLRLRRHLLVAVVAVIGIVAAILCLWRGSVSSVVTRAGVPRHSMQLYRRENENKNDGKDEVRRLSDDSARAERGLSRG